MKRLVSLSLTTATLISLASAFAQDAPRPEPPRPPDAPRDEDRPPFPPGENRGPRDGDRADRPPRGFGDREPGDRPGRPFMQRRRDGMEGPAEGRPPGDRRMEGGFDMRGPGDERRFDRFERRDAEEPVRKPTAYLGVVTLPAPPVLNAQLGLPEGFGLVVEDVLPDSPAQKAGVQRYDVLKLLNDQQLVSPDQLARLVRGIGKDIDVSLTVLRKGQEQKIGVKIGEKVLPQPGSADMFPPFRGFDGDRTEQREQFEQLRRRMEEMNSNRQGDDAMRGGQDRMRAMQDRMRAFQDSLKKFQEQLREWQKNPTGEPPQMPELPGMPPGPGGGRPGSPDQQGRPGVRPADLLRELRPGGAGGNRAEWTDGTSRWDTARARAKVRDADGEIEIGMKDGHRTVTAKSPSGEVIFDGTVDTPEQLDAVPEKVREKLKAMAPPPGGPNQHRGPDAGPIIPERFVRPGGGEGGVQ